MQRCRLNRETALCLLATLIPIAAWGGSDSQQGSFERRRPPREAFDACVNKSEGDTVTITTPQGSSIRATCRKFDGQLVAAPEGAPPPPPAGERGSNAN